MNSLLLISRLQARGFNPIISGNLAGFLIVFSFLFPFGFPFLCDW